MASAGVMAYSLWYVRLHHQQRQACVAQDIGKLDATATLKGIPPFSPTYEPAASDEYSSRYIRSVGHDVELCYH